MGRTRTYGRSATLAGRHALESVTTRARGAGACFTMTVHDGARAGVPGLRVGEQDGREGPHDPRLPPPGPAPRAGARRREPLPVRPPPRRGAGPDPAAARAAAPPDRDD